MFDLVLKGGRLIDPAQGSGLIVVPGLIDPHTHVYWGGTSLGVDPGAYAKASGLTTLIATVLTLEQGEFVFEDVLGEKLIAEQKLACRGIVLGGRWWHG
jgi:imidazolonepropionase-like amidohydrolase